MHMQEGKKSGIARINPELNLSVRLEADTFWCISNCLLATSNGAIFSFYFSDI